MLSGPIGESSVSVAGKADWREPCLAAKKFPLLINMHTILHEPAKKSSLLAPRVYDVSSLLRVLAKKVEVLLDGHWDWHLLIL